MAITKKNYIRRRKKQRNAPKNSPNLIHLIQVSYHSGLELHLGSPKTHFQRLTPVFSPYQGEHFDQFLAKSTGRLWMYQCFKKMVLFGQNISQIVKLYLCQLRISLIPLNININAFILFAFPLQCLRPPDFIGDPSASDGYVGPSSDSAFKCIKCLCRPALYCDSIYLPLLLLRGCSQIMSAAEGGGGGGVNGGEKGGGGVGESGPPLHFWLT